MIIINIDNNLRKEIIHKYINEKKSCKKIHEEMGISTNKINNLLRELNLLRDSKPHNKPYNKILEENKESIINLYKNKNSILKISKIYNIPHGTIYKKFEEWNIDRRSFKNMGCYEVDYKFFNKIDCEEKAYWLGFMYADGYISDKYIGLTLSSRDKSHIEKFKIDLKSNHDINDYYNKKTKVYYSRLLFRGNQLITDLQKNGCVYKKSLVLTFPNKNIVPNNLIKHFIRGYFDGDGSLVLSKGSINFKICGTSEFLLGIINKLNENISNYEFKEHLYKRKKDNKNNYYISYGGRVKTLTVMKWLYEDCTTYLNRKYELFKTLKTL